MTVRELIAELSKYPPDAEVRLETREGSVGVDSTNCYASRVVKVFGDDLPEDDNEKCDECGYLVEDCECGEGEPDDEIEDE